MVALQFVLVSAVQKSESAINIYLLFVTTEHWVEFSVLYNRFLLVLYFIHVLNCFSYVELAAIPWAIAHQVRLSMGFSRQKYWYWSGLPFPSPGDLPDPGIEPMSLFSPVLACEFFTSSATREAGALYTVVYICESQSSNPSHSPHPPPQCLDIFLCVCVYISALQIGSSVLFF